MSSGNHGNALTELYVRAIVVAEGMGGDCRDFLSHNTVEQLSESR